MFDHIFFLPQVKQTVIISNKHGAYELPNELSKRLKTWHLRKYPKNLKASQNYSLVPIIPLKMKILSILSKNSYKKIPAVRYFTRKLDFASSILSMITIMLPALQSGIL